jgi:hypothetical protein
MMRADVDGPMQVFEEQRSIIAPHFWRAGTGAYECDAEACPLDVYFSLHVIKRVMSTVTRGEVEMFSIDVALGLLLQVTGFASSSSELEACVQQMR